MRMLQRGIANTVASQAGFVCNRQHLTFIQLTCTLMSTCLLASLLVFVALISGADCYHTGEQLLKNTGLGYTVVRSGPLFEEPGGYKALIFDQVNRQIQAFA